jgi:hypothetical protein
MLSRRFSPWRVFASGHGMESRSTPRAREYLIAMMIYAAGLAAWFGAIGLKLLTAY